MSAFKSHSQAGQDIFVHSLIPGNSGSFVDIGCCHPVQLSNTYALEQLGWKGALIDNDPGAILLCKRHRTSPVFEGDSTKLPLLEIINEAGLPDPIDYLSLDVDNATLGTLKNLPLDDIRFRVITIEHDQYRFGDAPRAAMREILKAHDYKLVCADVRALTGEIFEDWWVDPWTVDIARYEPFQSSGKKWSEILTS